MEAMKKNINIISGHPKFLKTLFYLFLIWTVTVLETLEETPKKLFFEIQNSIFFQGGQESVQENNGY